MSRLHEFGDPPECSHLIRRGIPGDGGILHVVVGFDDETAAPWMGNTGEGHGEGLQRLGSLEMLPLWVGGAFYGRIKESVPCAIGNADRERTA